MALKNTPSRYNYKPLGRMAEDKREVLVRGALEKLGNEETLINVAASYKISKATLIAALMEYAEEEWKSLQIARAQVAVQKAAQKREEIAKLLDEFSASERAKLPTGETDMTYPRIREQLRIAEHDERSAQWHLERLARRIYGNSVTVQASLVNVDSEFLTKASELLKLVPKREPRVIEHDPQDEEEEV